MDLIEKANYDCKCLSINDLRKSFGGYDYAGDCPLTRHSGSAHTRTRSASEGGCGAIPRSRFGLVDGGRPRLDYILAKIARPTITMAAANRIVKIIVRAFFRPRPLRT